MNEITSSVSCVFVKRVRLALFSGWGNVNSQLKTKQNISFVIRKKISVTGFKIFSRHLSSGAFISQQEGFSKQSLLPYCHNYE